MRHIKDLFIPSVRDASGDFSFLVFDEFARNLFRDFFLFIPFHSSPKLFSKLFPEILARSKNITYLCHRYNSYVEHST